MPLELVEPLARRSWDRAARAAKYRAVRARSSAGAPARSLRTRTTRAGAPGPSARSSASRLLPRPETATATCIGMGGEANRARHGGAAAQSPNATNHTVFAARYCRIRSTAAARSRTIGKSARGGGKIARIGAPEQQSAAVEPLRGHHVPEPIADPPAPGQVETMVGGGEPVERDARLPAVARSGQVGMVGAVVVPVEPRAGGGQQLGPVAGPSPVGRLVEQTRGRYRTGWSRRWPGARPD